MKQKIVAYITRNNDTELLVFDHEKKWSEAGTQVPAGSLEFDESLEEGLLREIKEESGLTDLEVIQKIDEYIFFREDLKEENLRHVFHLRSTKVLPDSWEHIVTGEGIDKEMIFTYRWISVKEAKSLLSGALGKSIEFIKG